MSTGSSNASRRLIGGLHLAVEDIGHLVQHALEVAALLAHPDQVQRQRRESPVGSPAHR